jgi:hypothetical protein
MKRGARKIYVCMYLVLMVLIALDTASALKGRDERETLKKEEEKEEEFECKPKTQIIKYPKNHTIHVEYLLLPPRIYNPIYLSPFKHGCYVNFTQLIEHMWPPEASPSPNIPTRVHIIDCWI